MMNKQLVLSVLKVFLINLVLILLLFVVSIFAFGFLTSNFYVFSDFHVLSYSSGFDQFVMGVYLTANAGYIVILFLIFLEIDLFLARTFFIVIYKELEKLQSKKYTKVFEAIKWISLMSIFRVLKINTPKKSIITYVVFVLLVFGLGFLAKSFLKQNDVMVYRVYENVNLYSEIDERDFSTAISEGVPYSIVIETNCGNVHLYQVDSTSQLKLAYYYDDITSFEQLVYSVDEASHTITVRFNLDMTSYTPYVDPLLSAAELYIPSGLSIGDTSITIHQTGNITMDYVSIENLMISAFDSDISISAKTENIQNYHIDAFHSNLKIVAVEADTVVLNLQQTTGNVQFGNVKYSVSLSCSDSSNLSLSNLVTPVFSLDSNSSTIFLREVYPVEAEITLIDSDFSHYNGSTKTQPNQYVVSNTSSQVNIRGVEYDNETND